MNVTAIATRDYTSAFPNPISVKENDSAVVSHCDLEWKGWVWITLPSGKTGWAPQQILSPISSNEVICLQSYTAQELSVCINDHLIVVNSLNGWYYAEKNTGEIGWVPHECVRIITV